SPGSLTLFDVSREGRALLAREEERNGVLGAGPGQKIETELSWLDFTNALDLSSDGKSLLLLESSEAAGPRGALLLRKMDGSAPVQFGDGGFGNLSPGADRILIAAQESKPAIVKVVPIGPGESRSIKLEGFELRVPFWHPDGRRFLALGREPGHPFRVFIIDPDTGARQPI